MSKRDRETIYRLKNEIDSKSIQDTTIIGPSPMFFNKVRGRFRWQIILRSPDPTVVLADLQLPQGWIVDIDPISLL